MKKLFILCILALSMPIGVAHAATTKSGSAGLEGIVAAPAPTQGATITIPHDGQVFTSTPITVSGLCPAKLLVEIYKNGVFAGSTQCNNGSFSLQVDLFDGQNDLVAKVFDDLNQQGPDSNKVSVTFNNNVPRLGPQLLITTAFSKRGALPGDALTWPIVISGGASPYALSIDWGDKTTPDLVSQGVPGQYIMQHVYKLPGVYTVTVKATDSKGNTAFLQLVGIGNGPIQQTNTNNSSSSTTVVYKIIWWPIIVLMVCMLAAFWLGRKNQLETIKKRIRKGEQPI